MGINLILSITKNIFILFSEPQFRKRFLNSSLYLQRDLEWLHPLGDGEKGKEWRKVLLGKKYWEKEHLKIYLEIRFARIKNSVWGWENKVKEVSENRGRKKEKNSDIKDSIPHIQYPTNKGVTKSETLENGRIQGNYQRNVRIPPEVKNSGLWIIKVHQTSSIMRERRPIFISLAWNFRSTRIEKILLNTFRKKNQVTYQKVCIRLTSPISSAALAGPMLAFQGKIVFILPSIWYQAKLYKCEDKIKTFSDVQGSESFLLHHLS